MPLPPCRWYTLRRNRADPAPGALEGGDGLRVVDADSEVLFDDDAAAVGNLPLQRVAGQTLVGRALPDEAPEVGVLGALGFLNGRRHLLQLGPGRRRGIEAMLLEQVGAVVEDSGVGVPGDADEFAVHRVVVDDAIEVLGALPADRLGEIDGVGRQNARPDDVDHHGVDVGGLCSKELLVLGQTLGRRLGTEGA